jgi:hypothetical protein
MVTLIWATSYLGKYGILTGDYRHYWVFGVSHGWFWAQEFNYSNRDDDTRVFQFFCEESPANMTHWPHIYRHGNSVVPLWMQFLGVAIPTAGLWLVGFGRRIPAGHCQQCGYNLTGNTSGVCPECGEKI